MDSVRRARFIRKMMGGNRSIYWDRRYKCFRVIAWDSSALVRFSENYELVEKA